MSSLIDKIAGLLPALEEHGIVYLFALAEREDIERWDVLISSQWSDEDSTTAVRTVVDLLKPRLKPEEITMISRIAIIPSNDERIQEMPASLDGISPENRHVVNVSFLGSEVRRLFVFKALHPPKLRQNEAFIDLLTHA